MKLKSNKVIQKIALILICLLIFNFIAPTYVSNADIGGALFSPIKALILTIGDVALNMVDWCFYGKWNKVVLDDCCSWKNEDPEYNMWNDTDSDAVITYPIIRVSPEMIFANQVELFNINFINKIDPNDYEVKSESTTDSINALRATISNWYVAIRNLSLVIMLSILIYVGIKIIISSSSQDKAKYKQLLMDWIIGICLLFMLHYIMAFILKSTELVTELVSGAAIGDIELVDPRDNTQKLILQVETDKYESDYGIKKGTEITKVANLTSYVRLYTNLYDVAQSFGYVVLYLFMIFYTISFCVVYIKRMITVAFLTVIAPFVAMTYPIDKMKDGKAQAFNFWLKEYIFNALLQPCHLILWSLLVGASIDLVKTNLIYAIVVMACLKQAEKLIKEMFGMNSKTAPGFAGMAAPAAATALANQLTNRAKGELHAPGQGKDGASGKDGSSDTSAQKMRTKDYDFNGIDAGNLGDDSTLGEGETPPTAPPPGEDSDGGSDIDTPTDNSTNELAHEQKQALYNNLDNNQQNELDNYFNSPAYGNGKDDSSSTTSSTSNNEGNEKLSFKQKAGKLAGYGASKAKKGVKNLVRPSNLKKAVKYTGKKIGKGVLKSAAGAGLAIGGGAMGLALGGLTGNAGLAFSAMAGGATMGLKKGTNIVDRGIDKVVQADPIGSMANFKNEALYGGEKAYEMQKERDFKQQKKDYQNNKENIKFFKQKTGASGKELDAMMESASDFSQMGAKDNDEVLKALELEKIYQEDNKMSKEKAHQLAGISAKMISEEGYKAADFANERKRKEIETRTADVVRSYGGNLNEQQQKQLTNQIMTGNEYMAEVRKREKTRLMNFGKKKK